MKIFERNEKHQNCHHVCPRRANHTNEHPMNLLNKNFKRMRQCIVGIFEHRDGKKSFVWQMFKIEFSYKDGVEVDKGDIRRDFNLEV